MSTGTAISPAQYRYLGRHDEMLRQIEGQLATGATGAGATGPTGSTGRTGPTGVAGPTGPAGGGGSGAGATGPTGADGATGPAGLDGATGPSGAAGLAGATGPAGLDGATGVAGATGPAGLDGATGAAGAAGATGPAGLDGATGPAGLGGSTGPSGAAGATGPTGAAGGGAGSEILSWKFDGATGATDPGVGKYRLNTNELGNISWIYASRTTENGAEIAYTLALLAQGMTVVIQQASDPTRWQQFAIIGQSTDSGFFSIPVQNLSNGGVPMQAGESVNFMLFTPGTTGPTGIGDTGPTGIEGPTGPQGNPGLDGYNGSDGPTGPEGPQGLMGPQGDQGFQGPEGPQGPQGIEGPTGPEGLPGYGQDGATGPEGPTGPTGLEGATGPTGVAGLDGTTGPTGTNIVFLSSGSVLGVSGSARYAVNAQGGVGETVEANAAVMVPAGTLLDLTVKASAPVFTGAAVGVTIFKNGAPLGWLLEVNADTGPGPLTEARYPTAVATGDLISFEFKETGGHDPTASFQAVIKMALTP